MAYGNWGAFVHKDGARQRDMEDANPFEGSDLFHAVLGTGPIQLCGHKVSPVLFVNGEQRDMDEFNIKESDPIGTTSAWEGTVDGYVFAAERWGGNMLGLRLVQPDGVVWSATCGFQHGAGWDD